LAEVEAVDPWWTSAEFLIWWTKDAPCPVPLATTAPFVTNPANNGPPGALGNSDTTVVLGGSDIAQAPQLGGRFTLGRWLTDDARAGFEANFLFLSHNNVSKTVTDNGTQWLTSPFDDNALPPTFPDALPLAIPGVATGSATLNSFRQVYGAELNGVWALQQTNAIAWQMLAGYRYFNVNEELDLGTTFLYTVSGPAGLFSNTLDQFRAQNHFNGGQIGIRGEWTRGNWFFASTVKLALGSTHEVVDINGSTTTNAGPGFGSTIPVTTVPGGLYAQPTNIGQYSRDRFAVLPEVTLRLGAKVTANIRTFVGYNFLYLSSVVRPGNQIDGTINITQSSAAFGVPPPGLSGQASPTPRFKTSDFWAQGLNLGAEISW
jgi:hypothetical protein